MRVLIYEPDPSGHHFDYVRLILPWARALASHITLGTSPRAAASEQYRVLVEPALKATAPTGNNAPVEVDSGVVENPAGNKPAAAGKPSALASALARADQFIDCVRRTRPDHVIVPYADGLSQALVIRKLMLGGSVANDPFPAPPAAVPNGTITSEALFMRGSVSYPAESFKRALAVRASWKLQQWAPHNHLFHLDPLMFDWIARHHPGLIAREPGQRGWSLMPDPTSAIELLSTAEARRRMSLPEDGLVVGSVGVMDKRKGIDLLIRSFIRANLPANAKLLLVGKQDQIVRDLLKPEGEAGSHARNGRIIAIDRFVEVHELAWALQAMDLVATPYPRHVGSASIAIKAAAAQRPVLGCNYGWVDAMVNRFGLGATCQVEDIAAFSKALEQALPAAHNWKPGEGARRFVAFHSEQNFGHAWSAFMRHRLGLSQPSEAIQWSWVLEAAEK